ncbi:MAG: sugar nucleotide-binding protein [bacterium]|nr:sugar nucleotide-binding protein [bacterium]
MKIHLLGSTGYVGSWIRKYFSEAGYDVHTISVDVRDRQAVQAALKDAHDSVVINATGKTGKPNVDWCEDHKLETAEVNITGAVNVCSVASAQGNYVVQIGSGCIFNSECGVGSLERGENSELRSPNSELFTEDDKPNFYGSFYSATKAVAEGALREIPNVCILRIRMPLQGSSHPKNLLDKLLGYSKVMSVPNSVTVMEDLMPFIERVIEKRPTGPLNAVNPGVYEHRDLLELYRELVDGSRQWEYIGLEEFSGMVRAERSNCVLSTKRSEEMGIAMPPVQESLRRVVESYRMP